MVKKVISSILLLSMCFCIPVFAADDQNTTPSVMVRDGEIVIMVDSQEEEEAIVEQIERDNIRAQQLWENAVEESLLPENQISYNNAVSPYATTYVATVDKLESLDFMSVTITFEALFTKTTNVAGATVFGSVKNISAYAKNSKNKVSILNKNYKLIDSARTIAANYSLRISVYNSGSGGSNIYSRQYYVEFYVSGNGQVY